MVSMRIFSINVDKVINVFLTQLDILEVGVSKRSSFRFGLSEHTAIDRVEF